MGEHSYNFSMMTINIRGLNERKKRRNVFRWIKRHKIDVCLVQETYSSPEVENIWSNEWGRQIIFSHGTNHGRGVMILIRPKFEMEVLNTFRDDMGRMLFLDTKVQDTYFKICNVYAPNTEDAQFHFYHRLRNKLQRETKENTKILLGGDFNFIQNPSVDRKASSAFIESRKYQHIKGTLNEIKSNFDLDDIWRLKNPDKLRFTWSRTNPTKVRSRLDFFLTSLSIMDNVEDVDIIPCIKSDHSAVVLKLKDINMQEKGRGVWKLNTSFLDEEDYVKGIIENKAKWLNEFIEVTDAVLKWELVKYKIRQYSRKYGKQKALKMKMEETQLEARLQEIETLMDSNEDAVDVEEESRVRNRLQEISEYKTNGLIMRSQARWHEKGEKSTKYFLRLETRNKIRKSLRKLKKSDDSFTTDPAEILSMQADFYENLYKARTNKTAEELNEYLSTIETPTLTEEERSSCEGLITEEECRKTVKTFKANKSPGNDHRIPIEFYKKFWPVFGQLVVDSFNTGYMTGKMSVSQRQAVITLLDKGKDRTLLKNWRPISLLNVDYKIASKTIANRITRYLPKIIHRNQVGYVQGRNITDNIRTVIDIMDYLMQENLPGILINIDFEKAFDSLDWVFLEKVLEKYNFGEYLIRWIKLFYTDISSCIINNGSTSPYFAVGRGVRQGDPLSPYLFILCVEILASRIRQEPDIEGTEVDGMVTKLLQYADDTSGILKNIKSAKQFLEVVEKFGTFSGLKLNKDKTEGMWLGSKRNNKTRPLGITWPERPLRLLGVHISYDAEACKQANFKEKLNKIKSVINLWKCRELTMIGRAQIIKTFLISQLLYVSSAIDVPPDIIVELDNIIFDFIWKGKKPKLKRNILKMDIAKGGLTIPDFTTMLHTSKINWIKRIFNGSNAIWPVFLTTFLKKSGIHLETLLHSNYDIASLNIQPGTLPSFYKDMLKIWSEIGNNTQDKETFLWYNKNILINGKSFFYNDFDEAGVKFVHDLYDDNLNPVPFTTWVNRGIKPARLIKWIGLIQSTRRLVQTLEKPQADITPQPYIVSGNSENDLATCKSKDVYMNLLYLKLGSNVVIPRIEKYLGTNNDQNCWSKVYLRANKLPVDTKTKEFQYKFLQDILVNRYWLKKWQIVDTDQCMICNLDTDNIEHVFWNCVATKRFWSRFKDWYESKVGAIELDIEKVFIGCDDPLLCILVFIGKRHIYNRRSKEEPPEFAAFLQCVNQVRNIELHIAKTNGTLDKYLQRWEKLNCDGNVD